MQSVRADDGSNKLYSKLESVVYDVNDDDDLGFREGAKSVVHSAQPHLGVPQ